MNNIFTMGKSRKMTPADLEAAKRLREAWGSRIRDYHARGLNLTQDMAAESLDMTKGAVSRYLRGLLPLGPRAVYRWAAYLRIDPYEIRPDLNELLGANSQLRTHVNVPLLGEAIGEIERLCRELGADWTPKDKGRIVAIVYADAVQHGGISSEMIRGIIKYSMN